ncbi:protein amnionless [Lingula anatina]|uniref:Protein amnionless n=1 Tax=Lingula anatina TaxID=7574 RepID=A0A1S3I6X4_LINAN|nr:protein amnionless [Lingula anatina]|eukprot:XP_013394007.1 protein amnionless [Lingula anatina]
MVLRSKLVFFCMIWILTGHSVEQSYKRWKSDTNFFNGDNWEGNGNVNCSGNRILFPSGLGPIVYMNQGATFTEMVLPTDGILVLGNDITMPFTSNPVPDPSCAPQDMHFTRTQPKSWFDPSNWCQALHENDDQCGRSTDLLDTEKIPCQYNDVIFPPDKTFYVDLSISAVINVKSLRIGRQNERAVTLQAANVAMTKVRPAYHYINHHHIDQHYYPYHNHIYHYNHANHYNHKINYY